MGTGQREAGMLASALERDELQHPWQVAREVALVAASPDDGQVRCVQLGEAAVLGHHPGYVRAPEPQEGLPLSVRLSVGRLLDEAGLEDVRRDEGLYVALWQGGADAWRHEQASRPLTPQALVSHALLVAVHPEVAEVVFGTDRLLLTGDGVVLVTTSSSYRLESRGGGLKLLVVMGTRLDESATPQGSEHAVPLGSDEETGRDGDEVGREQPTGEEQQQDQQEVAGKEVAVQAIVAAALARFAAAASTPPTTEALEEEDQRRRCDEAQSAVEQDEELEILGAKEAREVGPRELGLADKAGPKTGEVETCRHWAKGWCMRADACRYVHPQPPVPRGAPQELLLILEAMARVGALSLDRSQGHGRGRGTLLQEVVVKAQGGGLPAVGYAVESGGLTEWAVALPCGMAALLTPFPVVPWRDMVTVQEANLGWVCKCHTHPAVPSRSVLPQRCHGCGETASVCVHQCASVPLCGTCKERADRGWPKARWALRHSGQMSSSAWKTIQGGLKSVRVEGVRCPGAPSAGLPLLLWWAALEGDSRILWLWHHGGNGDGMVGAGDDAD